MTGRTVLKHTRFYADGYDLSGYTRQIGPLETTFDEHVDAALNDEIKNALPGHAMLNVGTLNGFMDNTATSGLHVVASGAGAIRVVMCPIGIKAAPAAGDPVFCGQFEQQGYQQEGDSYVYVTIPFSGWSGRGSTLLYHKAWGTLLHAKGAETAANTGTGIDDDPRQAETTAGGYLVYQVFSGDGTATISIDDSADNASFAALSGATTGSIDCSSPTAGLVALGTTTTVRRYLRWQLALGTATTVTFALAFVRG